MSFSETKIARFRFFNKRTSSTYQNWFCSRLILDSIPSAPIRDFTSCYAKSVLLCRRHSPHRPSLPGNHLLARRAGRSYRLLASARGGQHFVKSCIGAEFCQQWIGKQIAMRAIVLFDRALQQMKSRLFLAAEREKRSLVIPRLRVGLGG